MRLLPRRFSDEGSEAGETLIEVLMSTALMGIVVLAIIGGMSTMLIGSSINRKQADGNAALVSAMEQLKSPDSVRACTYSGLPSGVTLTSIQYQ
ncbi:MAG: hypothetical protein QOD57_2328, partial [Actinomycetota bacterium]|nr:hypothetical protein [Actinomycetota bacterium]